MAYVLILGAKSDIAKALAYKYAKEGYDIYLAGRNITTQENADLIFISTVEKRNIINVEFDALDFDSHKKFYENLEPKPKGVVVAFGYLGDQKKAENDFTEAKKIFDTNFTGAMSILEIVASDFEKNRDGFIVGISSVAGDRGRQSNYFYGSSKAALTSYLSGLRNRLSKKNVRVLTVKPGFVKTKMTENMKLPAKLTAQPKEVAHDIYEAQISGKDIVYTKWFWKWIMLIIKFIPEPIFKKLSL